MEQELLSHLTKGYNAIETYIPLKHYLHNATLQLALQPHNHLPIYKTMHKVLIITIQTLYSELEVRLACYNDILVLFPFLFS